LRRALSWGKCEALPQNRQNSEKDQNDATDQSYEDPVLDQNGPHHPESGTEWHENCSQSGIKEGRSQREASDAVERIGEERR